MDSELNEGCIAIVGMSGRFPCAPDVETLWRRIQDGHVALRNYTDDEVAESIKADDKASIPYRLQELASGNWVPAGYYLEDIDKFDAGFFGYSPSDAELLDPQQRLFLEVAWAAIEDAGYVPDDVPDVVGVFGGAALSRYFFKNIYSHREIMYSPRDLTAGIGNEPDYITNRVAFKLNFQGPAVTVQTACSTSLVAVHQACQSLISGETDMCLAGGVLVTVPGGGYLYREGSMSSPDGLVRSFDARAEGTVFSEAGVAIVCLKRLDDAVRDGDQIYSVILSSAVGNDGSRKVGYTAPGIEGQAKVIGEAVTLAGISPDTIGYMESHGTGTPLGDPVEIAALTQAWRTRTDRRQFCALGSIKPNVGHLATVAGVASLIKAALVTRTGRIPKLANFETPNPRIDFETTPFYVPKANQDWPQQRAPRRAAVSSFGIGGTNAHVILQEPPAPKPRAAQRGPFLLPLSARTQEALSRQTANLADWLEAHPTEDLRDVAFTLQHGRKPFAYRASVVGSSPQELAKQLRAVRASDKILPDGGKTAWMFSGQGAQYVAMARDLHGRLDTFTETLEHCLAILSKEHVGDLRSILFPAGEADVQQLSEQLAQTAIAQPALVAIEYALARQLQAFGFVASHYIGHSLGEYVAACLSGVFGLNAMLRLVALRGRLMQSMPKGSMLAVGLDREALEPYIGDGVGFAAENTPTTSVLSGPTPQIQALKARLDELGHASRLLVTSHAFHSSMMEPVVQEFEVAVRAARPSKPTHPFVSNLTGELITGEEAIDPKYWGRHLLNPVRFHQGLETLAEQGVQVFVEVGPGNTLATLARRTLSGRPTKVVVTETVRHPRISGNDLDFLLGAVGRLHCAGVPVEWIKCCPYDAPRRVSLPTYSFERERHWLNVGDEGVTDAAERLELSNWFAIPSWASGRRLRGLRPSAGFDQQVVVLLAPNGVRVDSLAESLEARHARVVRFRPEGTGSSSPDSISVDFGSPADLEQAIGKVAGELSYGQQLVFVQIQTGTPDLVQSVSDIDSGVERHFFNPLALVQAVAATALANPPIILSVVSGAAAVLADDRVAPLASLTVGVHLCAGHEMPSLKTCVLDIGFEYDDAAPRDLCSALLFELEQLSNTSPPQIGWPDKVVAYRQGLRWTPDCSQLSVPASQEARIQPGGVYLVTGGLGGLGLEMAEWLAREGAGTIYLTSRRPFLERENFETWLSEHDPEEETSRRIVRIRTITTLGATVHTVEADGSDREVVAGLVQKVWARHGRLDGAIHAAGVAGGGVIQLKQRAQSQAVLCPKVHGADALCTALATVKPDFVLLFSSIFGYVGGTGQVDYCAGNAFLDTYAHYARNTLQLPVLSIAWGAFSDVGMAARHGRAAASGLKAGRLLAAGHPMVQREVSKQEASAEYGGWLEPSKLWLLSEHEVSGRPTVPGTALLEMVRASHEQFVGQSCSDLTEVNFFRPFFVDPQGGAEARVTFQLDANERCRFEVLELDETGQRTSIAAGFVAGAVSSPSPCSEPPELSAAEQQCIGETREYADGKLPLLASADFLQLGEHWDVVRQLRFGEKCMLAELRLPEQAAKDARQFGLHPSLLDMGTGPITGQLLARLELEISGEFLPASYGALEQMRPFTSDGTESFWSYVRFNRLEDGGDAVFFDIDIFTHVGEPVVSIRDFALRKIAEQAMQSIGARTNRPGSAVTPTLAQWDDSISPAEGAEAMARILSMLQEPQISVCPVSLPDLVARIRSRFDADAEGSDRQLQKRDATDVAPPENDVQRVLVGVFEQILGVQPVGIHDNFFDLGGDSVMGIQIVSQAKSRGLTFKPSQLFEHQTIAELSSVLEPTTHFDLSATGDSDAWVMTPEQQLRNVGLDPETAQYGAIFLAPQLNLEEAKIRLNGVLSRAPFFTLAPSSEGVWRHGSPPETQIWVGTGAPQALRGRLAGDGPLQGSVAVRLWQQDDEVTAVVFALHPALGADVEFWRLLAETVNSESWEGSALLSLYPITTGPRGETSQTQDEVAAAVDQTGAREVRERLSLRYEGETFRLARECFERYRVTPGELLLAIASDLDVVRWPVRFEWAHAVRDQARDQRGMCSLDLSSDPSMGSGTATERLLSAKRVARRAHGTLDSDVRQLKRNAAPRTVITNLGQLGTSDEWLDSACSDLTLTAPDGGPMSLTIYCTHEELIVGVSGERADAMRWQSDLDVHVPRFLKLVTAAVDESVDFVAAEFQDAGLSNEDLAALLQSAK